MAAHTRIVSVLMLAGVAATASSDIFMLTGHSHFLYITNTETWTTEVISMADGESDWTFLGMTRNAEGRIFAHTSVNGVGSMYEIRGMRQDEPIARYLGTAHTRFNSIAFANDRLFAVENQGALDVIVELDPNTFTKINDFRPLSFAIGGMAYNDLTDEFVFADVTSRTFYAVSASDPESDLRVVGESGTNFGGNGVDILNGRMFGAFIRRNGEYHITLNEVDLSNGQLIELSNLGLANLPAGTGFALWDSAIPSPNTIALLGFGSVALLRRRRTRS